MPLPADKREVVGELERKFRQASNERRLVARQRQPLVGLAADLVVEPTDRPMSTLGFGFVEIVRRGRLYGPQADTGRPRRGKRLNNGSVLKRIASAPPTDRQKLLAVSA
ncbi:hypothetical protein [Paraburkholderia bannensis]|uniref:hypothetical protein n=1 Tax=Paraburkholderia bannensis TaxID=765414 RepID=UPI002ABD8F90|nr:hypothetical protein [Paraburkholderia bannensis]